MNSLKGDGHRCCPIFPTALFFTVELASSSSTPPPLQPPIHRRRSESCRRQPPPSVSSLSATFSSSDGPHLTFPLLLRCSRRSSPPPRVTGASPPTENTVSKPISTASSPPRLLGESRCRSPCPAHSSWTHDALATGGSTPCCLSHRHPSCHLQRAPRVDRPLRTQSPCPWHGPASRFCG
jgi:hypothetical protein